MLLPYRVCTGFNFSFLIDLWSIIIAFELSWASSLLAIFKSFFVYQHGASFIYSVKYKKIVIGENLMSATKTAWLPHLVDNHLRDLE